MGESYELRSAIERLYAVFEPYQIEHLTAGDLERYAFKAMTTWGSVEDFKHFLPRVLELAAAGAFGASVDVEVIFSKLEYADWIEWSEGERAAVDDYLRALWLDLLSRYPHPLESDVCLCAIGNAVDQMAFYLHAWSAAEACPPMLHLADFVDANVGPVYGKRQTAVLRNAFWDDRPEQAKQVSDWLLDPARVRQIKDAFFRCGGGEAERLLSAAREQIELLHRIAENKHRRG